MEKVVKKLEEGVSSGKFWSKFEVFLAIWKVMSVKSGKINLEKVRGAEFGKSAG